MTFGITNLKIRPYCIVEFFFNFFLRFFSVVSHLKLVRTVT